MTKHNIAIGVTGGIAAYKACEVVSRLVKLDCDVQVVMTQNATEFVRPLTFEALTNRPVRVQQFADRLAHIELAKWAELFLVVPTTANVLGKVANGIADDILTTSIMATHATVVFAPAMNTAMLQNSIVQSNIDKLQSHGYKFVMPSSGRLACGDIGQGKLASVDTIVQFVTEFFAPNTTNQDLQGKTVLISAGATIEHIDPVRYISNHSSGKMGLALAECVHKRGGNVIFVHGKMQHSVPKEYASIAVTTTDDMYNAVAQNCKGVDIFIMAAAPADYTPQKISDQKIKSQNPTLSFVKTKDIAAFVGQHKTQTQKLVVFCAESQDLISNAKTKLTTKKADLVVANDITQQGAGFGVDTNIVALIDSRSVTQLPLMSKTEVANAILDKIREK